MICDYQKLLQWMNITWCDTSENATHVNVEYLATAFDEFHSIVNILDYLTVDTCISSAWRQKGITGYCFKYIDRPFCLRTDVLCF